MKLSFALILVTCVEIVYTFQFISQYSHSMKTNTRLYSTALVKKGKLKEINTLIENMNNMMELQEFVRNGTKALGVTKPNDFFKSVMNRYNSISVMVYTSLYFTSFYFTSFLLLLNFLCIYRQSLIRSQRQDL